MSEHKASSGVKAATVQAFIVGVGGAGRGTSGVAARAAKTTMKRGGTGKGGTTPASSHVPSQPKADRSASKKRTSARRGAVSKRRGRSRKRRQQPAGNAGIQPAPQAEAQQQLSADGLPREHYNENAYSAGYELGLYEGGELLLEQAMPINQLLPEISLREIIALGAEHIRPLCLPLMDVHGVYAEMEAAINEQRPCAVVRLGDGELLTLAQEGVYDAATIRREGGFLPYAGVNPPDLKAKEQLAQAIRQAHIVGVPLSRRKHFQPLLYPVLRSCQIAPGDLRMTHSAVNYDLQQAGLLSRLLSGKRLLVIGNLAPALGHKLVTCGFTVTGTISPVRGVDDVERVMQEVGGIDFNLALVSAGIAAVMLCTRIAVELGRTALDFGHMADGIVKGRYAL